MSKLSLKKKVRKNLPYGRYRYVIVLKEPQSEGRWSKHVNAKIMEPVRERLHSSAQGLYRFKYRLNYYGKRHYTHLFLTHSMDLAICKLCYGHLFTKIYEIVLSE